MFNSLLQRQNLKMNILLLHFAVTCTLVGLIWLVQVVHYPSFRFIPESDFKAFSVFHTTQITWVVAPLMVAELLLVLRMFFETSLPAYVPWSALALTALVWASTAFIQVPLHGKLALGKDQTAITALINSNWIRTIAWSSKAVVLAWAVLRSYGP